MSPSDIQVPLTRGLSFIAIVNLLITVSSLSHLFSREERYNHYTYVGSSHPFHLPIAYQVPVEMMFYDSLRFTEPGMESVISWRSIDSSLPSNAWARLGVGSDQPPPSLANDSQRTYKYHLTRPYRLFTISMFHNLHCLRRLNYAFFDPFDEFATEEHVQHCLGYLRQHILCMADDGLEYGDTLAGQDSLDEEQTKSGERKTEVIGTRTCEDWSEVYRFIDDMTQDWDDLYRSGILY